MEITDVVARAYNITIKNPILFLPLIIWSVITIVGLVALIIILLPASFVAGVSTALGAHSLSSNSITGNTIVSNIGRLAGDTLPASSFLFIAFLPVFVTIALFLLWLILPAMYVSMVKQVNNNKKISLSGAFYEARSKYLSLLGAYLIEAVVVLAIIILFLAVSFGLYVLIHGWLALAPILALGFIFLIGLLYVTVLFYQTTSAIIIEARSAIDAVKSSIKIGKENVFSIFALFVLFYIIWFGLSVISAITAVIFIGGVIWIVGFVFLSVMQFVAVPIFYYSYVNAGKPTTKPKRQK